MNIDSFSSQIASPRPIGGRLDITLNDLGKVLNSYKRHAIPILYVWLGELPRWLDWLLKPVAQPYR